MKPVCMFAHSEADMFLIVIYDDDPDCWFRDHESHTGMIFL